MKMQKFSNIKYFFLLLIVAIAIVIACKDVLLSNNTFFKNIGDFFIIN